jgi:hypothetical protein
MEILEMNLRTTLVLLVLVAAGPALFWFGGPLGTRLGLTSPPSDAVGAGTLEVLDKGLSAAALTRIEVQKGERHVVLERSGGEWTLPGKWPARKAEVEELVAQLSSLHSRFLPIPLGDPAEYGLDKPALTVTVRAAGTEYRLALGERPADAETNKELSENNRFSKPTYLRLDDKPEVVRLRPGLIAALDRPADYYQQRRLFPSERVARESDTQEKTDRLIAHALAVKDKKPGGSFSIVQAGDNWELREPVRDRVDPDKLRALRAAAPDIWAEKFVDKPDKDLDKYGLKDPEQTLSVTRPNGDTIQLLIGKESPTKEERTVPSPPPPPQFGGQPPPPPMKITETFRYAKIQNNEQIFEIKTSKLKDVLVPANDLRDARLARFKSEDARKIELSQAGQDIVLIKDKERWRIEKPLAADAEMSKINELLDKLSGLQAREPDIIDKADPKTYGLDKPAAKVKVTVEEETKESGETKKKTRVFAFDIGHPEKPPAGTPPADKPKTYVRVEGWERVNAIDDANLLTLVKRPALAYRGRRVLDFVMSDVDKIDVQRSGETVGLKHAKETWSLTSPVTAQADALKASKLAGDLSNLEAVEYVNESPKPEELEAQYGLGKPAVVATVTFTDQKKPAQTLQVGKQVPGKQEYYAKLASAPGVFAIKKETLDALDQSSLGYRPLQLWTVQPDDLKTVKIQKEGQEEYQLSHKGADWQIAGPFEATAMIGLAQPLVDETLNLRGERYEAHKAADLAKLGLDKPYLRLTLASTVKEEPKKEGEGAKPKEEPKKADAAKSKEEPKKEAKEEPKKEAEKPKETVKERVLLIGKPADKDAPNRYAKLADSDAVFLVSAKFVTAIDKGALDLLNRGLLTLEMDAIEKVKSKDAKESLALQKDGKDWKVAESPAPPFIADPDAMARMLGAWANLHAQKFAAYGPKADLARYGLDKPEKTLTITVKKPAAEGKPAETVDHTLTLGKSVGGAAGERYARLDNGPGVAVLSAAETRDLSPSYLDLVNRTIFKFDAASVNAVLRKTGNSGAPDLEIAKRDDGWHVVKPADQLGDEQTMQRLLDQLSSLRGQRVAAYPAKDLQAYGLDAPVAVLTVRSPPVNGKPAEHVLKIGKPVDANNADRYVKAEGSPVVAVLSAAQVTPLLANPIYYRDRSIAKFADADKVVLERGVRKAVFAKPEGTWKQVEPLAGDAEQTDLEDFLNAVARLRADELVADKPADLKPYGLDKPEARWRFLSGDKEVLNLLVGNQEKNGPRVYAKLATGNLVFLLDPKLTGRVLGEYRSRSIWTLPPDASQVDYVRFGFAQNPFTLEKIDNTWKVAGKPDVPVKQEAVNDLLAAVAGLKATRYVVDKGAEFKLYGLDPPELVLELGSKTGSKTLQVGRPEGDSKRYYARVPDKDRSDVFIISEPESARIVRTLMSLTGK